MNKVAHHTPTIQPSRTGLVRGVHARRERWHQASIPAETIEAIRAASPIEEIVADHVRLRRSGAQFLGPCPFHEERTPSFSVSPAKKVFHCFGCGVGGDVFKFIQLLLRCGFSATVAHLAQRAGIALEGFSPSPELRARVAELKAKRGEETAFERFCSERIQAVMREHWALARAATRAEECLRSGKLHPDEEELGWAALGRYRLLEAKVERESLCDLEVLRAEWQQRQSDRNAAA